MSSSAIMSVSCSDCFSDLLCGEDSGVIFSYEDDDDDDDDDDRRSPEEEYSSTTTTTTATTTTTVSAAGDDSIAGFMEEERNFVPGVDYLTRFRSRSLDASARASSVAWMLKVHAYYGFQPLTAYLAVNYFDRFLYSRRLPQTDGWPLQLLSVACLSLAAKMEELLVPSLLDFQLEGAKYIFEPRTIQRMELLVLSVLDWRLRSVTPFSFIAFFACKLDPTGASIRFLISRVTEIILSNIQEASLLEYRPSCIAAAAILSAANEVPSLSMVNAEQAESWCDGLCKEKIIGCYGLMKEVLVELESKNSSYRKKAPNKIIPHLRVTIRTRMRSSTTITTTTTTTTSSSSSSSSSSCKRRKLNNYLWVNDDKGNF